MAGNSVIGALRVTLGLDSAQFETGLKSAQRELARAGGQLKRVGGELSAIGSRLSVAVTLPVVAFGAASVKAAGDFEQAMNRVAAVSGATGRQLRQLSDLAKELGATTQFTASEAADAMGFLAMAGMNANEVLGAMPRTLQLAASAQLDMASAADIVTNVLAGYGLQVEELGRVNDVLVKAFTSANTDLRQLAQAMKFAGPVASAAGVQFEEAAAALGLMGNAGIQASMAGTSLRGAISRMLAAARGTGAVAKAAKAAGLSFTDAQGRLLPLVEIIEQLEPHAADAGLFMQLFGQRAGPAMASLVSQGSGSLRELTKELEDSGGTAARIAEVQMKGFNGAMRELKSAFEALQIAVAESGLLDFVADLARDLAGLFRRLAQANPVIINITVALAGLAAVIGPLIFVFGQLAMAVGSMIVLWGIGGLTGLLVAFGPIVVAVIAALTALVVAFGSSETAVKRAEKAQADYRDVTEETRKILKEAGENAEDWGIKTGDAVKPTDDLAAATDDLADKTLKLADARRQAAVESINETAAELNKQRAALVRRRDLAAAGSIPGRVLMFGTEEEKRKARAAAAASVTAPMAVGVKDDGSPLMRDVPISQAIAGLTEQIVDLQKQGIAVTFAPPEKKPKPKVEDATNPSDPSGDEEARKQRLKRGEIELQAQLGAARLRGDVETERALQRQLDLTQRISQYEAAGLNNAAAKVAAQRDENELAFARAQAHVEALGRHEDEVNLRVAQIAGDAKVVDLFQRKAEKQRLIATYREAEISLAEATARAEADLLRIEDARLKTRERLRREAQLEFELELARARGDSEASVRGLERRRELDRRTREIMDRDLVDEDTARAQAQAQIDALTSAENQGKFRDFVKGGFRAALDEDLGDFLSNFFKERAAKGLEDALNSLADMLYELFSDAFSQTGATGGPGGGGGWGQVLKTAGSLLASVMGRGDVSGGWSGAVDPATVNYAGQYATGGSFMVGGAGGIDRNLVAFRASRGERVDVLTPAQQRRASSGGGVVKVEINNHAPVEFDVREDDAGVRIDVFRQAGRQAVRSAFADGTAQRAARLAPPATKRRA